GGQREDGDGAVAGHQNVRPVLQIGEVRFHLQGGASRGGLIPRKSIVLRPEPMTFHHAPLAAGAPAWHRNPWNGWFFLPSGRFWGQIHLASSLLSGSW
ncbi:hypothetical protein STIAU_3619, partial [Stigmatella aurantiaca DW4/3-1]